MIDTENNLHRSMRIVESPQKPSDFFVQSKRPWDNGEHRTIATFHTAGYGMAGAAPGDAERDALMLVAADRIVRSILAAINDMDSRGKDLAIQVVDSTPVTGGAPDDEIVAEVRANHRAKALLEKVLADAMPSDLSRKWMEASQ